VNQELLNQLQQLNFNTASIPADATDELLKEILRVLQLSNANPKPAEGVTTTNADPTANPAAPMPTTGVQTPAIPALADLQRHPEQVVMKFRDELMKGVQAFIAPLNAQLAGLKAVTDAQVRNATTQANKAKAGVVTAFLDEMGRSGQVAPAARPAIEKMLLVCDHVAVTKFSDGKTEGTTLEERMSEIRSSFPKSRQAPNGGNPTVPQGTPGIVGAGGAGDKSRVNSILNSTPEGRAALARRKAVA
jgi:hypothetical protein